MLMAVYISFRRTKNHRRSKRNPQSRKMHSRHSKEISKRYETADCIKERDYDVKLDTVLASWHLQSASYNLHLSEICTNKLMERNRPKMSFDLF